MNGFSFTPPPLIMNGQTIAGGLNFNFSTPVAQVDQASQAYNFINTINNSAYGFEGNAITQATNAASAVNKTVIGSEQTLGAGMLSALQTEANALQTAASKLSTNSGGLFGSLF